MGSSYILIWSSEYNLIPYSKESTSQHWPLRFSCSETTFSSLWMIQALGICVIWYWILSLVKRYQKLVRHLATFLVVTCLGPLWPDTIILQPIWLCQLLQPTNPFLSPAPRPRRRLLNDSSSFKPLSLLWSFLGFLLFLNSFAEQWSMHFVLFIQEFIKYPLLCQPLCFEIL